MLYVTASEDATIPTADEAETIRDSLYRIVTLAAAVQHILKATEEGQEQPLCGAANLCVMIQDIAHEQASRADKLAVALTATQES